CGSGGKRRTSHHRGRLYPPRLQRTDGRGRAIGRAARFPGAAPGYMVRPMAATHQLTAHELVSAYQKGELSPVEVVRAALARIDAWEPKINAMYRIASDAAMVQAREAEARWRKAAPLSALDGVPITIKENIGTRGDPAPLGVRCNEDAPPQAADAPAAARVREAGCVLLGKTTMPDFGMLASGVSSLHGVTRNPWRLDRNTSGASSGAG